MFSKILLAVSVLSANVLMLATGSAWAQELISAKVLSIEGQVEIRRPSNEQPQVQKIAFKVDDELRAGDTIITGRRGRLVLGLSDGSQAVIAPQTTVVIKDLRQSPRTLFNVIRGKTRVHIEKLGGQPNPYRVNTPTAVIAVRGTIFDVLVAENETQVFVHEGEVAVTNLILPNQAVLLFAGQMTRVLVQRLPDRPSLFKVGRNDGTFQGNMRITVGGPQHEPGNRRIAAGSQRQDQGNRQGAAGGAKPDSGRGSSPSNSRVRPDFGRGSTPSNASRPNASPRTASKKP